MAKPTEKQIKDLEKAHKQQLVNLLQAIAFRKMLYSKTFDGKTGKYSEPWKKYADLVWKLWSSWYARQKKLEKGGATKEGIIDTDWNTQAGQKKLKALAKKWDQTGEGVMGFIPLLIWAAVAIAGFFTADEIVDELTTTTEEQSELINTSKDFCTKYNLNAEECKQFMVQQNTAVKSEGSATGTMVKWGIGLFVAYKAYEAYQKNRSSKTT